MKIWKEGYQVVIVPDGETKEEFITSLHTRMEFSSDGLVLYIRDIAPMPEYKEYNTSLRQETFRCLTADVKNQAGVLVGGYQQVRDYLLTFIGS